MSFFSSHRYGRSGLLSLVAVLGGLAFSACADEDPDETMDLGPSYAGGTSSGGTGGITSGTGLSGGVSNATTGGGVSTTGTANGQTTTGGANGLGSNGIATTGGVNGLTSTGGASGLTTTGGSTGLATTGSTGGETSGSTGQNGEPQASIPPCLESPSQVVAMGDSYVSLPVVLIPKIEALAVADGALSNGQHYRDYSFPGTTLGSPSAPGSIPPQWDAAVRADPNITTLIMDGGGNDLILGAVSLSNDCLGVGADQKPACTGIVEGAMDVVRGLAAKAKAQGVQDIVYFLYPHVPLGGDDILDYSVEQAQLMAQELSSDGFRMHLVDTRPVFEGHPEYFGLLDPIHANAAGAQEIAKLVWQVMKDQCIAQPASSGCCMP